MYEALLYVRLQEAVLNCVAFAYVVVLVCVGVLGFRVALPENGIIVWLAQQTHNTDRAANGLRLLVRLRRCAAVLLRLGAVQHCACSLPVPTDPIGFAEVRIRDLGAVPGNETPSPAGQAGSSRQS